VDAGHVYWTNQGDGTVMRAPRAGGTPELLAAEQVRPSAIAVDEGAVYWLNEGSPDLEDGSPVRDGAVMRVLKP
jgi:hypothetical protein